MSDQHTHEIDSYGTSKKTLSAYVSGLLLCILLTLAAFALVEKRLFTDTYLYISLATLAIVQLFVQVVCFLRLNANPEGRWNLMPFLVAILLIAILVGGTLWIMYNLNYYMMH